MSFGSAVTLLSNTLDTNSTGNLAQSFRLSFGSFSSYVDQIRVTFKAASAALNFDVNNASLAIIGAATYPSVDATHWLTGATQPIEMLFSGVSGFNISPGTTITSDWTTCQARTTDILGIILDWNASVGGSCQRSSGTDPPVNNSFNKAASASYNVASVSGYSSLGTHALSVSLIEGRMYNPDGQSMMVLP